MRVAAGLTGLVLAVIGSLGALGALGPLASADAASSSALTATRATTFAFRSTGFGTKVIGGQLPAGSNVTGYQAIGCTNQAGRSRTNDVAQVTLPGLGTAQDVRTHVWTTSRRGVVTSHSDHSIANLVLAQSQLGSLAVSSISSHARAYHDDSGFHAVTTTKVGAITLTPAVGPAQTFPAPTPDQPVAIPGLATIYAGQHITRHSATGAAATAYALRIDMVASGSTIQLAHSHAQLNSGLVSGIFGGHSAATHVVTAGGDIVSGGRNPLNLMPCQGTNGKNRDKSLASIDLGGQVVVQGATTRERAAQDARSAHGIERAAVEQVSLGGGQLVVNGIVGEASVRRTAAGVTSSDAGTQIGSVTANGQGQTFPDTGVLEIPGVARLERDIVTRSTTGIAVIGLRITLLDGSGAVIDLAEARLGIHKAR